MNGRVAGGLRNPSLDAPAAAVDCEPRERPVLIPVLGRIAELTMPSTLTWPASVADRFIHRAVSLCILLAASAAKPRAWSRAAAAGPENPSYGSIWTVSITRQMQKTPEVDEPHCRTLTRGTALGFSPIRLKSAPSGL